MEQPLMLELNSPTACTAENDKISAKKPPLSPRPQSASPKPSLYPSLFDCEPPSSIRHHSNTRYENKVPVSKSRVRSSSAGRSPDLRARYWALLFENLRRAVDEIYQTCELDESELECEEAILILENYTKDFRSLTKWLKLSKDLESRPKQRPTSLAWEIRKSSPAKGFLKTLFPQFANANNQSTKTASSLERTVLGKPITNEAKQNQEEGSGMKITNSKDESKALFKSIANLNNNAAVTDENKDRRTTELDGNVYLKGKEEKLTDVVTGVEQILKLSPEEITVPTKNEVLSISQTAEENSLNKLSLVTVEADRIKPEKNVICKTENNSITEAAQPVVAKEHVVEPNIENNIKVCSVLDPSALPFEPSKSSVVVNATTETMVSVSVEVSKIQPTEAGTASLEKNNTTKLLEKVSNTYSVNSIAGSEIKNPIQGCVNVTAGNEVKNPTQDKSTSSVSTGCNTEQTCSVNQSSKPAPETSKASVGTNTTPSLPSNAKQAGSITNIRSGSLTNRTQPLGDVKRNAPGFQDRRPFVTGTGGGRGTSTFKTSQYQNRTSAGNFRKVPAQNTNVRPNYTTVPAKQIPPLKMMTKNEPKTGSTSSISSTSSCQSWADKVKGVTTLDSPADLGSKDDVSLKDDNDGWETVHRGRTRSRNSPVKKIASESNLTQIDDKAKTSVKPLEFRSNSDLHEVKKFQCSKKPAVRNIVNTNIAQTTKKITGTSKEPEKTGKPFLKRDSQGSTSFRTMSNLKQKQSRPGNLIGDKVVTGKTNTLANLNLIKTGSTLKGADKKDAGNKSEEKNKGKTTEASDTSALKESAIEQLSETITDNPIVKQTPKEDKIDCAATEEVKSDSIPGDTDNENKSTNATPVNHDGLLDEKSLEKPPNICEKSKTHSTTKILNKNESQDDVSLNELNSNECSSVSEISKLASVILDSQADSSADDLDLNDDDNDEIDGLEELDIGDDDDNPTDEVDEFGELLSEEADRLNKMGLSWGDQMDELDLELRTPGRALQVHEKLSSPFKKRSLSETIRLQEEKQTKAQEQRERLLVEKQQRLKGKVQKAEEKKAMMEEQLEQKRLTMEIKLQKAEEKRKLQIQNRIRKARDEEEKVNEIAFINTLEAQNKRHDLLSREKDHEARLSELMEERQKKQEEKAAKEAAAEERRKALEAERLARLEELKERRKLKDMKIEQQLQEKEKERIEIANQKAREREQRISAMNAAQIANAEELQKKIQQKQEESARRHEENIEQIRQKAFELSVRRYSSNNDDAPRLVPYETKKMCTLCNVLIGSEVYLLSHLRGKKHQESVRDQHQGLEPSTEALELYNLKHIVDATSDQLNPEVSLDKERQKALKKRCKKIRQRMINRGSEWEKSNIEKATVVESDFKQKYQKHVKEVRKHICSLTNGSWENSTVTSLERALGEFERSLEKGKSNDQLAFSNHGGISALIQLLELALKNEKPDISKLLPLKTLVRACIVLRLACRNCHENSQHFMHTNKVVVLLDLLMHRLNILLPDIVNNLYQNTVDTVAVSIPTEPLAGALLSVLSTTMTFVQITPKNFITTYKSDIHTNNKINNETLQRIQDIVSYAVSMGIVDKLSHYLSNVQAPIDAEPQACEFLLQIIDFMSSLAKLMDSRYEHIFESKKEDNTQLLATFRVTQLGGAVSLLYGTLLHSGAPSRGESCPPQLPKHTEAVSLAALRMLNYLAMLDIQLFQTVLGGEGLSLQLRHISSYLIWYSTHWSCVSMLHEVILLVGHFTVLNNDNQSVIQSGQRPTILQQLSALPFPYFSDPELTEVLFPTLIACCFDHKDNKDTLEQDMSTELLSNYLEGCLLDVHKVTGMGTSDTNKKSNPDDSVRWALSSRFPKNKWTAAKKFFAELSGQSS